MDKSQKWYADRKKAKLKSAFNTIPFIKILEQISYSDKKQISDCLGLGWEKRWIIKMQEDTSSGCDGNVYFLDYDVDFRGIYICRN